MQLTAEAISTFLAEYRVDHGRLPGASVWLLLEYLRAEGAVRQEPPGMVARVERLVGEYREWLVCDRGLAPVSELIAVNRADVACGTGAHVRVEGKGRKHRAVPLTKDAQAVLSIWLRERGGQPEDPLFPTRTGRRLTRDAVERRVATHVATAARGCPSLAGKRVHPHVLRHSCAMSLLQARVDSTVIALWLGHADTSSTQHYSHADMTIKKTRPRTPHATRRRAGPLHARRRRSRLPRLPRLTMPTRKQPASARSPPSTASPRRRKISSA